MVVPKRMGSSGLRAWGSPLHATHFSPRSTTPLNQRVFCSSVAMPSSRTSELTCPSQQRASERSARAISLVIIQSVNTSPVYGPSPWPSYSFGTTGASRPARKRSSKSSVGKVAVRSYSAARGAKLSRASTRTRSISSSVLMAVVVIRKELQDFHDLRDRHFFARHQTELMAYLCDQHVATVDRELVACASRAD